MYNVLVLDMQPIDPPVGGGRLRLLGLYHNLGKDLPTTYVGSYDWAGEKFRDHKLSETLREIDIPLSEDHFVAYRELQGRVGGKTIIDVTFHQLGHLSPDYTTYIKDAVHNADIVVFSHPWTYPLVKEETDHDHQTLIYDAQNVEGLLRYTLLDDGGPGTEMVRETVRVEYELCHFADSVLVCSEDDRRLFGKLYGVPIEKMKLAPNGVFTDRISPVSGEAKAKLKRQLGLREKRIALFVGSNYPPNIEAAEFLAAVVAPLTPDVTFVIAGGVGTGMGRRHTGNKSSHNVKITGFLEEREKNSYLLASDVALNPMFSGSGTNIKMFEYMAAGLPIVSTTTGARGITERSLAGIIVCDGADFGLALKETVGSPEKTALLGRSNRELAERRFSWEKISPALGTFFKRFTDKKRIDASSVKTGTSQKEKIALMTTWDMRCGIAEYSRYLAQGLESSGLEVTIISNENADLQCPASYYDTFLADNVYALWKYDNTHLISNEIQTAEIVDLLQKKGIRKLNIQYHVGFFTEKKLHDFVNAGVKSGIDTSVTLHNSKRMSVELMRDLGDMGVQLFVHNEEEKLRIERMGVKNIHHVRQGVIEFPDMDIATCRLKWGITKAPVLGSFGFLRPHKGILELLEAVDILRKSYPEILLLGLNALYPSDDSERYFIACSNLIRERKLESHVILKTEFLSTEEIIDYLHAVDVVVLPYHESDEGASATGNMAIAARRPIITSRSSIFSGIKDISYQAKDISPSILAAEIGSVLSDANLLRQLKGKAVNYAESYSWQKIAHYYVHYFLR